MYCDLFNAQSGNLILAFAKSRFPLLRERGARGASIKKKPNKQEGPTPHTLLSLQFDSALRINHQGSGAEFTVVQQPYHGVCTNGLKPTQEVREYQ